MTPGADPNLRILWSSGRDRWVIFVPEECHESMARKRLILMKGVRSFFTETVSLEAGVGKAVRTCQDEAVKGNPDEEFSLYRRSEQGTSRKIQCDGVSDPEQRWERGCSLFGGVLSGRLCPAPNQRPWGPSHPCPASGAPPPVPDSRLVP